MEADKQKLFADKVKQHFTSMEKQINEALGKDKTMLYFDAIALEAIRLKIEGWDKLGFEQLREKIKALKAVKP